MDSRLRGNDIKGSGNDPSEARLHGASIRRSGSIKEECSPMILWAYCNTPLPLIIKKERIILQ
jgi:hypothetical protein